MITLKTLSKATPQAVFNQAARHLIKQNKSASVNSGGTFRRCVYRTKDGLKCAAGCFISDREYSPAMDADGIMDWHSLSAVYLSGRDRIHNNLIAELQQVHDKNKPSRWPAKLRVLARQEGFKVPKEIAL